MTIVRKLVRMEEIKTTSKLLEIVEDNHAKYRALIDTIGSLSDNLSFVSGEQSITRLNKENSLASILPRLGVLADNSFPSLTTNVSDMLFAKPSTISHFGIDNQHRKLVEPSTISHFGIDNQHSWKLVEPSTISHFGIDNQHSWEFAKPKEDSITAILGKFNYPSLLTKENDFLAITAKGYNFDNLQKVNYFLGDVATSAIQAVNGKFDNYSLVNVATKVTKDLISIDFKELNEVKDSSLGFYKKLKDKAQSLIDYFSDVFKNKGRYLPKNVEEFIEFWFDYNREILGFEFEKLYNYQIHENDLILFHYCIDLKCEMRLDTINEAFDLVWKTVDKRNQKLFPPSQATAILENNTSTLENNEILFDKEEEKLELVNYFICDVSTYNQLMKFMSDNGFINSVTKVWNLRDYTKEQLGEFIRMLQPLGYTHSLTIPQRQAIASFFIDKIAISTLKGTPPTNFSISNKQIPYAIEMKSKVNNQIK